ncbi:MAG TPA: tetratricopeptide repeat protein, partial [Bdellovibrionales bacterium]|nr:tetratricopeptide repeat protein [Bdellovibrionales bacterium]
MSKYLNGTHLIRLLIAIAIVLVTGAERSRADEVAPEKMTSETHTVVIEKLETALKKAVEDETVDLAPVRSRLADLYSERARLREMEEAKQGCQDCKGALKDRTRALELYRQVAADTPKNERGNLLIHMAHVYLLVRQPAQALKLYEEVIADGNRSHSKEVLAAAYLGRAESQFARAKFAKAQSDFETAFQLSPADRRGPIAHRIAWCQLNQGDQETAVASLVAILKNPAYTKLAATEADTNDVSFTEQVVMDLATFVARGKVTTTQMNLVEKYAPKNAKLEVMRHFANELERLGQKDAALLAWSSVAAIEPSEQGRL